MFHLTYEWEHEYLAATLEADSIKLAERITTAEARILNRIELLRMDGGGTPAEQSALFGALVGLDKMRAERLPKESSGSAA
jgi:hypothetical protein